MRNLLGIAVLAIFSACAQEPAAHAPGHGEAQAAEEKPMENETWWKLANFAVLAGIIGYFAGKYGGPYFRSRTEDIQSGIRDAAEVRAEAEARAAAIERKVGNLSSEIDDLKATSKAEIAAEGARLQAETQAQIAKVQAQAEMQIASAAKNATLELKAYSAQLALELAEKQIREELDIHTQEELANSFVNDLRQQKSPQAGRTQ